MQDFYETQLQQEEHLGQLQLQGLQLGQQLADPFYGYDYLAGKYPALKDTIQQLRNEGIPDSIIEDVMTNEVEPRLRFVGNNQAVNDALGRTPESMQTTSDYEGFKLMKAYRQAFPDKSDDEIFNAIDISRQSGVDTTSLLKNPKLYEYFLAGRKERETLIESAKRGYNNYLVHNDMGAVGFQAMLGRITSQDMFRQREELSKKIIDEPAVMTFANKALAGAGSISAQGYKNSHRLSFWGQQTCSTLRVLRWILCCYSVGALRGSGGQ